MAGVAHYENFPVASWLCPARIRPAVQAIYGFARTADDLADEGDASPAQRLEDLALYQACLQAVMTQLGASELNYLALPTPRWDTIFKPLAHSLQGLQQRYEMQLAPIHTQLLALLSAFEQDCTNPRYAICQDVLDYCARSANPVGRVMLALHFGTLPKPDSKADALTSLLSMSDSVCTGLQLVNFWQDFGQDWARGRCYLSQEDLDQFNAHTALQLPLSYDNLMQHPALPQLLAAKVQAAKAHLQQGLPLPGHVSGRLGLELALVIQGGLRIAEKLAHIGYDTRYLDRQRPKLNAWDGGVVLARGVLYWLKAVIKTSAKPPSAAL